MTGPSVAPSPNETDVILVRYWASARAETGVPSEFVPAAEPISLASLLAEVLERHPSAARVLAVCSVLVGSSPVGRRDPASVLVPPGSTVEFLPPFAGG